MIAGLARLATEQPWTLRAGDLERARAAGLDDDAVLHVLALAAMFGYLNRVADAVGVALDYEVVERPAPPDPTTPPLARAPHPVSAPPALDTARLPGLDAALAAWHEHAFERDAPLTRAQRRGIAATVAAALGDATAPPAEVEPALRDFAELVTLAPWRLGAEALAPLRAAGFADDATVFDVVATAAFSTLRSRLAVSLAALSLP